MVNGEVMGTARSALTLPSTACNQLQSGLLAEREACCYRLDFKQLVYLSGLQWWSPEMETLSPTRTEDEMVSEDFRKQVSGYGLTTAHILYRRPDHRWLLQSYVWQNYDLFPEFPELHRFLAFWKDKLEGPLHSVRVAHCKLIKPAELRAIDGEFRLH
jgi:uncharacterized protein Usg